MSEIDSCSLTSDSSSDSLSSKKWDDIEFRRNYFKEYYKTKKSTILDQQKVYKGKKKVDRLVEQLNAAKADLEVVGGELRAIPAKPKSD